MLILYVVAGFLGATASLAVLAQTGWVFAVLAAPVVASVIALATAGFVHWRVSGNAPQAAPQIPTGVVWC